MGLKKWVARAGKGRHILPRVVLIVSDEAVSREVRLEEQGGFLQLSKHSEATKGTMILCNGGTAGSHVILACC